VYVLGRANRAPSGAELDQMRKLTTKAMQHGALGVASALIGENCPEEFFNTICLISKRPAEALLTD